MKFSFNIVLENDRVKIEPLHWDHFDFFLPIAIKNPGLLKFSPPEFGTKEALTAYFENNLELKEKNLKCPFSIFDKKQMKFAGSTSFLNISETNKRIEIGSTWIGMDYQRTGLNRNCKFLLMQYVFEELKYERIEFKTDSRNKKSKNAIERIGGKYEGCLRSHTIMSDGFRRDTVCYSILRNEWDEIRNTVFKEIKNNTKQ